MPDKYRAPWVLIDSSRAPRRDASSRVPPHFCHSTTKNPSRQHQIQLQLHAQPAIMMRQDYNRIDPKRRNVVDYRKKQFATPQFQDTQYPHRLNFYADAPTADITLEQFEQWAIDRLRGNARLLTTIMQYSESDTAQSWPSLRHAPFATDRLPRQQPT